MRGIGAGLVLVAGAALLSRRLQFGLEKALLTAAARAVVQLLAVALVVEAVLATLGLAAVFVAGMVTAAAWTAAGRWSPMPKARLRAAAAIGAAAAIVCVVIFVAGALPFEGRSLIPLAGIVIGGAMVASGIAGQRVSEEIADHLALIETRLALGASAREALAPHVRRAVTTALIPALDQTRTVGLVTLPGAFIGMLLAGASPWDAAQVQLTVLLALLGAEVVAGTLAAALVVSAHLRPGDRVVAAPGPGPG